MRCDECGIVDISKYPHSPVCSQQRDLDYIKRNYKGLSDRLLDTERRYKNRVKQLKEEVTKWQGKFYIVKEENNKLRTKTSKG